MPRFLAALFHRLTRSSLALDERRFSRLSAMLEQIDRASRLKLYLVIARSAMVRGRMAVTRLAGERALTLSADASAERERAHFFRGASRVLTDEYDGGLCRAEGARPVEAARARTFPLLNATVQLALDVRKPFAGDLPRTADKPPVTPARLDLASSTRLSRVRGRNSANSNFSPGSPPMTKLSGTAGHFSWLAESLNMRGTSPRGEERRGKIACGFVVQRSAPHRLEPGQAGAQRRRRRYDREGRNAAQHLAHPAGKDEAVNERTEAADDAKSSSQVVRPGHRRVVGDARSGRPGREGGRFEPAEHFPRSSDRSSPPCRL
jgi:hypothetical protein